MTQREKGMMSLAKQFGPLFRASVLVPYVERFKREHGVTEKRGRNDHGITVADVLGDSMARYVRRIADGSTTWVGLYKAEELLSAMGFDGYVFHTNPTLRAAYETPDTEVYAYAIHD